MTEAYILIHREIIKNTVCYINTSCFFKAAS